MIKLKTYNFYDKIKKHVTHKLTKGYQTKELIDTGGLSGVGLTNALVEFATKYNLTVVLNDDQERVDFLKTKFKYDNVFSVQHVRDKRGITGQLVIDVGVDRDELQHQFGCTVVTGYYSNQK